MPQLLRRLPAVSVHILGKTITTVTVAKDLGIYIDQSLTYNDHITKIVSTWLHKLIQINRIKQLIDTNTLRLLLGSFVFSKLYECSSVWSNTSKRNIKKLQLVQNLAARIVFGLKNVDHSSPGIKSLNWLPVSDKLYLNDAVMMFKYIYTLVSITWPRNSTDVAKFTREVRDRVVSWAFRDAIGLLVSAPSLTEGQSFGMASVIMLNLMTKLTCLKSDLPNYFFSTNKWICK